MTPLQREKPPTLRTGSLTAEAVNLQKPLDAIDTYKIQALDAMKQTIDTLSAEVAEAKNGFCDEISAALIGSS